MNNTDPLERFRPLARLALNVQPPAHGLVDQDIQLTWIDPLAQLYEAASRGIGHLHVSAFDNDFAKNPPPNNLISIQHNYVMLPRMADAWDVIRNGIAQRHAQTRLSYGDNDIQQHLNRLLPIYEERDHSNRVVFSNTHQRMAVASLIDQYVGVLTGGPGTGKTTTAAALLALHCALDPQLKASDMIICAPTGKAANRLKQSLDRALQRMSLSDHEYEILSALSPRTLHRSLGWSNRVPEDDGPWRYNAQNPLPARLVLVDEASMADLELMSALITALPPHASLILLGDRDQLDSVEAGGVLAELVQRGTQPIANRQRLEALKIRCPEYQDNPKEFPLHPDTTALPGLAHELHWSFRAKDAPWILQLAELLQPGQRSSVDDVRNLCEAQQDNRIQWFARPHSFIAACHSHWAQLQQAGTNWRLDNKPSDSALREALDQFQVLVATNHQADDINAIALKQFHSTNALTTGALSHGCPIMISTNEPQLNLANGDVGIALGDGPGSQAMGAIFPGLEKAIPLACLPEFSPAFAMTIHKSQGSEWQHVAIDFGRQANPLLDRRLLYTGVTRASTSLLITGSDEALEKALAIK